MSTLGKLQLGRLGAGRKRSGGGSGGAPPLDGLSPTGAWSASRQLMTAHGGAFVTLDSGGVQVLLDQSGNTRNFSQGIVSARPVISTAVVDGMLFDGSNDGLSTAATLNDFMPTLSTGYMVVSFRPTGFPSENGTFYVNSPVVQDNGQNVGFTTRANSGSPLLYGGNYPTVVQSSIAANTPYVASWRLEGGVLYQRVNVGTEVTTATANRVNFNAIMNMGAKTAVYQGLIYEYVIFATPPNATQRTSLETNMGQYMGAVP